MRVLFLGIDLDGLHGSFLHILEYAQYFREQDDEVFVASIFISTYNKKILEDEGIHVFQIKDLPLNLTYDLVYALHLILFPALLARGIKYKKAILMSLSSQVPIEMLPPSIIWPQYDILSVISQEIMDMNEKKFGIDPKYLTLIPNHIPLNFLKKSSAKQIWNSKINKICVVSNHYNKEIADLKGMAPFDIDYYGEKYLNQVQISPELLLKYDAIITIGKTVQYCLGLGIPVFEYDKFGGCGYIQLENIIEEEKTNFSGRGTGRKLTSEELLTELISNYPLVCRQASGLRRIALKKYSLDKLIENQLQTIKNKKIHRPKLNKDALLYCNTANAAINYIYRALITNKEVHVVKTI